MRRSSGGSVKLSRQLKTVAATALPRLTGQHRKGGLLPLNPVTKRQFLTLLKDVKRHKIAEVTNKLPNTIYDYDGSGIIENEGNVSQVIVIVIYLVIDVSC